MKRKNTRRVLAFLLAFLMALATASCSGGGSPTSPASPDTPPPSAATPSGDGNENAPPAEGERDYSGSSYFGFFDKDRDYTNDPKFKIAFISLAWSFMEQRLSDNYAVWAKKIGCEYTSTSSDGNVETLISNVETYAGQGYDGLILNVYGVFMDQVNLLCKDLGVKWWSNSEVPRLTTGELVGPYTVTGADLWGYDLLSEEYKWMKENAADFDPAEAMVVVLSLTTIKEFEQRAAGCEKAWRELMPEAKFEVCDGLAEGGITAEIGYSMMATRYANNPGVKYWIIAAVMDTFAPGVLRFLEEYKLSETSILSSCGGEDLIPLFDSDSQGAWRFSMHGDLSIRFNSVFNGLYALLAGWAEPEDFWPDGILEEGDKYRGLSIGYVKFTPENYKDYLAFCDEFTGLDNVPYEWSGKVYTVLYGDGGATE